MSELLLTGILTFIATNLDDIFILILFFSNKQYKEREIIAGQFLGIGTLILVSVAASLLGLLIDKHYIGLLGLFPIYLGVRGIIGIFNNRKSESEGEPATVITSSSGYLLAIVGVTIANGGDNIAIYIPVFSSLSWTHLGIMIFIFLVMTLVWCLMAKYLVKHPYVAAMIEKYGHIITPFVLVLLGFYILYENGTIEWCRQILF